MSRSRISMMAVTLVAAVVTAYLFWQLHAERAVSAQLRERVNELESRWPGRRTPVAVPQVMNAASGAAHPAAPVIAPPPPERRMVPPPGVVGGALSPRISRYVVDLGLTVEQGAALQRMMLQRAMQARLARITASAQTYLGPGQLAGLRELAARQVENQRRINTMRRAQLESAAP